MRASQRAVVAALAAVAFAACDAKKPNAGSPNVPAEARVQAPSSTYNSLTGKFAYQLPGAWSSSVRIIEEPGVSAEGTWPGVSHAVHFVYQPTGAGAKSQTVLSILVYDDAKLGKKPVPAGEEIARAGGRVYAAIIASKNAYASGTQDHDRFQSLLPTLDAVKGATQAK